MYIYTVGQGNPEGTDYQLILQHEEKFTDKQLQKICEQAIVDALKKMCETSPFVALSCVDSGILLEILKAKGFSRVQMAAHYYLEPYWNKESIKNPELLEWAEGKTKDDFAKSEESEIKGE